MVEEGFCHPTFFEFLFYMAMVLFAREKVDVMVIETGLGGRLDSDQCVRVSQSLRDHLHQQGSYAVSWKHDPTDRRGKSGDHKNGRSGSI